MTNRPALNTWFNSSVLFIAAVTLETIIHESGHYLVARYYEAPDLTLHHNYVRYNSELLSGGQRIAIAAAGPMVSILTGILFHFIIMKYRKPGMLRLFLLYISAFGYIGCLGYLLIAPFFTYGDTGYICKALHFPVYLTVGVAVVGAILLYFAMKNICREFIPFLSPAEYDNDDLRKKKFNRLIHFPLYTGILFSTLLNLPAPTFLSLIAPICSPFSIMWGFAPLMRKKYDYTGDPVEIPSIGKINSVWIMVLVLTIILNRILVNGIYI